MKLAPGLTGTRRRLVRGLMLGVAAVLLLIAARLPWWSLTMYAPQYPSGLTVTTTLTAMTGDVDELNGLNHYIGMMRLEDAAPLERSLVVYAVPAAALLALLAALTTGWPARILALPLISFPLVFVADLWGWLYYAGHSLDPKAALSSSIGAFTPTLLGTGTIAQFRTVGSLKSGFLIALLAALLALLVLWDDRAAVQAGDEP